MNIETVGTVFGFLIFLGACYYLYEKHQKNKSKKSSGGFGGTSKDPRNER